VQIPKHALQSVKGPANTFDWRPKWVRTLLSLIYFSWDIYRDPLHKRKFKYQSWYLTHYCGLKVQTPTQALQSSKGPDNAFDWIPKWATTLPSLIYFSWDIYRDPLHKRKFKYQSWYLTPYCGLEVQKPTQALQSVKNPDNTFDWNPKCVRTLPSLIYLSCDIYREPLHKRKFKYQSWCLTPYCGLEVQKLTQVLQSVKDYTNILDRNPKWVSTLPSLIYFS
jgi:hypothetical protein